MSYIRVMAKVPLPAHPEPPESVQVPEIVFPVAVPISVRVLPAGDPDRTFIPNEPETLPLKFPLSVNVPDSVSPETKQGEFVEN